MRIQHQRSSSYDLLAIGDTDSCRSTLRSPKWVASRSFSPYQFDQEALAAPEQSGTLQNNSMRLHVHSRRLNEHSGKLHEHTRIFEEAPTTHQHSGLSRKLSASCSDIPSRTKWVASGSFRPYQFDQEAPAAPEQSGTLHDNSKRLHVHSRRLHEHSGKLHEHSRIFEEAPTTPEHSRLSRKLSNSCSDLSSPTKILRSKIEFPRLTSNITAKYPEWSDRSTNTSKRSEGKLFGKNRLTEKTQHADSNLLKKSKSIFTSMITLHRSKRVENKEKPRLITPQSLSKSFQDLIRINKYSPNLGKTFVSSTKLDSSANANCSDNNNNAYSSSTLGNVSNSDISSTFGHPGTSIDLNNTGTHDESSNSELSVNASHHMNISGDVRAAETSSEVSSISNRSTQSNYGVYVNPTLSKKIITSTGVNDRSGSAGITKVSISPSRNDNGTTTGPRSRNANGTTTGLRRSANVVAKPVGSYNGTPTAPRRIANKVDTSIGSNYGTLTAPQRITNDIATPIDGHNGTPLATRRMTSVFDTSEGSNNGTPTVPRRKIKVTSTAPRIITNDIATPIDSHNGAPIVPRRIINIFDIPIDGHNGTPIAPRRITNDDAAPIDAHKCTPTTPRRLTNYVSTPIRTFTVTREIDVATTTRGSSNGTPSATIRIGNGDTSPIGSNNGAPIVTSRMDNFVVIPKGSSSDTLTSTRGIIASTSAKGPRAPVFLRKRSSSGNISTSSNLIISKSIELKIPTETDPWAPQEFSKKQFPQDELDGPINTAMSSSKSDLPYNDFSNTARTQTSLLSEKLSINTLARNIDLPQNYSPKSMKNERSFALGESLYPHSTGNAASTPLIKSILLCSKNCTSENEARSGKKKKKKKTVTFFGINFESDDEDSINTSYTPPESSQYAVTEGSKCSSSTPREMCVDRVKSCSSEVVPANHQTDYKNNYYFSSSSSWWSSSSSSSSDEEEEEEKVEEVDVDVPTQRGSMNGTRTVSREIDVVTTPKDCNNGTSTTARKISNVATAPKGNSNGISTAPERNGNVVTPPTGNSNVTSPLTKRIGNHEVNSFSKEEIDETDSSVISKDKSEVYLEVEQNSNLKTENTFSRMSVLNRSMFRSKLANISKSFNSQSTEDEECIRERILEIVTKEYQEFEQECRAKLRSVGCLKEDMALWVNLGLA